DFKIKFMYNKGLDNNINLSECMDQGKIVLIKMKEGDFPTKMQKNILVTYWISKIWLATQLRGMKHEKPLRANILVDEVFQAPTCMKTLEYILPQSRKFGTKFIFSTQYMKQLDSIFETLEASGSSFMMLTGSTEDDFNHFKSKIESFEFEDLRDMEKFSSLNIIKYSGGYASFITKLPKPI
ncbi:MAG: type IV secretion system DNA-binding domain-containing protein, partial [Clostridium sp.]